MTISTSCHVQQRNDQIMSTNDYQLQLDTTSAFNITN